jgi:HEAT repeat protein
MMKSRTNLLASAFLALLVVTSCHVTTTGNNTPSSAANPSYPLGTNARRDQVMTSAFCADCHPAFYAEHEQNTHGRAFTDEEVRLATGRFGHGDCIRCHTPRPIFETGIGMNPIRRYHNLEEGNTCMTCHWQQDYDYSRFVGGSQCRTAFDPRVGTVEACASCHRNHGTPYQWEKAPIGKAAGNTCMTCHMTVVTRPVAVGEEPRPVRSHVFPGSRSESQLRRAYEYEARIEGNELIVRIANVGAGHNFPTELKQRSLESLVIVRDAQGLEVSRSRMIFRDPYKRPYGLHLLVNTQIPSGESREHRVPLIVSGGTADCELHFKLYYPIEDNHPDLARRLEQKRLVFDGITPSTKEVESDPEVVPSTPENIPPEAASPANILDYIRLPIGTVEVQIPQGNSPETIQDLIDLFMFPVPEANVGARERLTAIGAPAVPALVNAMGSWDNKTFKQAMTVLADIGEPAVPAITAALESDQLYVRYHARKLLGKLGFPGDPETSLTTLLPGLTMPNALDRRSTAEALGKLRNTSAAVPLRALLTDPDPDVVVAAALSLAQLQNFDSVPQIELALQSASHSETRQDLAVALAELSAPTGIFALLQDLDHRDDLIRERAFEFFFAVTGQHLGYDPLMPRPERLEAMSRLQAWWARDGGRFALRSIRKPDAQTHDRAWHLVSALGGGAGLIPSGDDEELMRELMGMGEGAVPALVLGLKFPPGFAPKRALICQALGRIGSAQAAPALAATLRDPVLGVASWAAWALEGTGDPRTLPALRRYQSRLLSLAATDSIPGAAGPADGLLAQAARSRLLLGDDRARSDLVNLLLSDDLGARQTAISALSDKYGDRRGYTPDAPLPERRAAAARWGQDAAGK